MPSQYIIEEPSSEQHQGSYTIHEPEEIQATTDIEAQAKAASGIGVPRGVPHLAAGAPLSQPKMETAEAHDLIVSPWSDTAKQRRGQVAEEDKNFEQNWKGRSEGAPLAEGLSNWVEKGPISIAKGESDIVKGDISKGGHEVLSGIGTTMEPALPFVAAAAPLVTLRGMVGSEAGGYLAGKGATALGATPDQSDLASDIGSIAGAGLGTVSKLGRIKLSSSEPVPELDATGENKAYAGESAKGRSAPTETSKMRPFGPTEKPAAAPSETAPKPISPTTEFSPPYTKGYANALIDSLRKAAPDTDEVSV